MATVAARNGSFAETLSKEMAPLVDAPIAEPGSTATGFETRVFGEATIPTLNDSLVDTFDPEFALCRQRVLSYLVKLHRSISQDLRDLSETLLHKFCQALTEYLSVSHQHTFSMTAPSARHYVDIASTSREAMRFIDLFARLGPTLEGDLHVLLRHLDQLALALTTRFELEDELGLGQLKA